MSSSTEQELAIPRRPARAEARRIDAVIPYTERDRDTLGPCVEALRMYVRSLRKVFVVTRETALPDVSPVRVVQESTFPFTADQIEEVLGVKTARRGWYLQQLLKLYAPFVVPRILANVLVVDADTVFQRPVTFWEGGKPVYAYGTEHHQPYFEQMSRLLPGLTRQHPDRSGICHHMLLQRRVLRRLFTDVEELHGPPFWKAFLSHISPEEVHGSGSSEYELYFNYIQWKLPGAFVVADRAWKNSGPPIAPDPAYDFISYHWYMRVD